MSTSRDSVAALRYSGGDEQQGSILQLSFDMGSRGADVRWVSQFPAERELLYPPCTSLTCSAMLTVGKKRVLQVTASVSTNRPNVSWCQEVSDVPPENRPRQPEKLGPFALHSLNFELYTCAVHGGMSVTSRPAAQRLSIREAAKQTLQKSAVWTVEGMRLSPVRPVTLQGAEREQAYTARRDALRIQLPVGGRGPPSADRRAGGAHAACAHDGRRVCLLPSRRRAGRAHVAEGERVRQERRARPDVRWPFQLRCTAGRCARRARTWGSPPRGHAA